MQRAHGCDLRKAEPGRQQHLCVQKVTSQRHVSVFRTRRREGAPCPFSGETHKLSFSFAVSSAAAAAGAVVAAAVVVVVVVVVVVAANKHNRTKLETC